MRYLLQHYFMDNFKKFEDEIALEQGDRILTYKCLKTRVDTLKKVFLNEGFKQGDRIAILSPVFPDIVACMIAFLELGITYIPMNIHAPAEWLLNVLKSCSPQYIIYDETFHTTVKNLEKAYNFQSLYKIMGCGLIIDINEEDIVERSNKDNFCLLYTSDAADE